ncbi:MAG: DUF2092 domain-containing protein [Deltaproteobacteria bacterium]|nr:DUF2092 domain-containing protein [Deltaproteobacteria bacterium]
MTTRTTSWTRRRHARLALTLPAGAVAIAAACFTACAHKTPAPEGSGPRPAPLFSSAPDLEPKAVGVLKAMSSRLASARTLAFTAVATYESPSRFGPEIAYTTTSEVAVQRPNKLRVVTPGDGPAQQFFYDGKTVTAYAPGEDLVATAALTGTIDDVLQQAYHQADIYFPFTDVVVADPYKDIADGLKVAFYVGQSQVIDGITTDMVVIANERVFAQIWVGAKDQLPRRVRAIYLDDPARLRHEVALSRWQVNGAVPSFAAPAKAAKAKHIAFARPEPQPPAGAPATTKDAPAALR